MRANESLWVRGLLVMAAWAVVLVGRADWIDVTSTPMTTQTVTSAVNKYGDPVSRQTVQTQHDRYGQTESLITTSAHTYQTEDLTTWLISRPDRLTATAKLDGAALETRVTAYTFGDGVRPRLLTTETKEPDNVDYKVVTTYGNYDDYGHPRKQSVESSWAAQLERRVASRDVENRSYDASGIFADSVSNALGHTSKVKEFDFVFGKPKKVADINGLEASYEYDGYGRVVRQNDLQLVENPATLKGTYTTTGYEWCSTSICSKVPGAVYRVVTTVFRADNTQVSPPTAQYFDVLGRPLQARSTGFDGLRDLVQGQVTYNALGQVIARAEPYYEGDGAYWSYIEYDAIGRVKKATAADGGVATIGYVRNEAAVTNALKQVKIEETNVLGKVLRITEIDGNKSLINKYTYDSLGRLITVADAKGNLRSYEYDLNGSKTVDVDPGSGRWTYTYNTLGQMLTQMDAKGAKTSFQYDALGRLTKRSEPELVSDWYYDTSKKLADSAGTTVSTTWLGMLDTVKASNDYKREYSYDLVGRPFHNLVTLGTESFRHVTDYDSAGRPNNVTYPGGKGYRNVYNDKGYLEKVLDAANDTVYWQAKAVNARGQVTRAALKNGVVTDYSYKASTGLLSSILAGPGDASGKPQPSIQNESYLFDSLGNLKSRANTLSGLTETYTYDALNRLRYVGYYGSATNPMVGKYENYQYDEIGNITFKSGVGNMLYQATTPTGRAIPHAVSSVAPATVTETSQLSPLTKWAILSNGGITFPIRLTTTPTSVNYSYSGSKTASYRYDENGRMTSGDGRTATWTSWGMPDQIVQGGSTTSFTYTAEHDRIRKVGNGCTILYLNPRIDLGGRYELETCGTKVTERWTLYTGAKAQGEYVTVKNNDVEDAAQTGMQYFHTDHLGSVVAVTNAAGQVLRMSYDAWGKRRNFDGTPLATAPQLPTTRGYTSHEMLDDLALVHMNGRLYEPVLGRFVSADPVIDGLYGTQGLNQFSYVRNNPLSLTDPSGHKKLDPNGNYSLTPGSGNSSGCTATAAGPAGQAAVCGVNVNSNTQITVTNDQGQVTNSTNVTAINVNPATGTGTYVDTYSSGLRESYNVVGGQIQSWSYSSYYAGTQANQQFIQQVNAYRAFERMYGCMVTPGQCGYGGFSGYGLTSSGAFSDFDLGLVDGQAGPLAGLWVLCVEYCLPAAELIEAWALPVSATGITAASVKGASTLFHYTDAAGMKGITESNLLFPSLRALNPKDARYGNGQYLSDILPGTMSCAQLSRCFIGQPFQGQRFTNYVEIDVTGLNVLKGREGVFVVPNESPLDLSARIMSWGRN